MLSAISGFQVASLSEVRLQAWDWLSSDLLPSVLHHLVGVCSEVPQGREWQAQGLSL